MCPHHNDLYRPNIAIVEAKGSSGERELHLCAVNPWNLRDFGELYEGGKIVGLGKPFYSLDIDDGEKFLPGSEIVFVGRSANRGVAECVVKVL